MGRPESFKNRDRWTVQHLIDALSAVEDKTLPIWAAGCDCSNPVSHIEVDPEFGAVMVEVDLS